MTILETLPGLLEALRGEMTPKFLATRSPDGMPNVVPCISILPAEDQPDTLFFGNFLLRKSIKNLESDGRLAVLVITPELQGWLLRGDFVEFQRTGLYVDQQMNSGLLRYNAYTGVRNAGVIRLTAYEGNFRISKLRVAGDYLRAWLNKGRTMKKHQFKDAIHIPLPVCKEFAKIVAVKVLAWVGEEGYPRITPALSLQPANEGNLVAWQGMRDMPAPPQNATVASNILTFDAISYQTKGLWSQKGKAGMMQVREVYAGGPPYPGGQVA